MTEKFRDEMPEAEPGAATREEEVDRGAAVFVTVFPNWAATEKAEGSLTLEELRDRIRGTRAAAKDALPLLKFGRFNDVPNPKTGSGSLRWNGNLVALSGIIAEYDGEAVAVGEAVERLTKACITALVYTSPSHTPEKPRWRVCCPGSREQPPDQHYQLVARLNGVLGGVLAPESFTLSQAFYVGAVGDKPPPHVEIVEGRFLDEADELDATAVGKKNGNGSSHIAGNGQDRTVGEPEAPIEDIRAALAIIPNPSWGPEGTWNEWVRIGLCVYRSSGGSEEGYAAWEDWSRSSPKFNVGEKTRDRWEHFHTSPPDIIHFGTLVWEARQVVPDWVPPSQLKAVARRKGIELVAAGKGYPQMCETLLADPAVGPWLGAMEEEARDHELALIWKAAFKARDQEQAYTPNGQTANWHNQANDAAYLSDQWLALDFVAGHKDDLRYTALTNRWYLWDGTRWKLDETLRVFSLAQEHCRRVAKAVNGKGASVAKVKRDLNSAPRRAAVVSLARENPVLAMHPDVWDADPWLLGTPGGIVDLRTGQLRPARPEDYISMATALGPGGDCPIWRRTLLEIFSDDAEMVRYHQRVVGYCATGLTREEKLFLFSGTGRNGKGTLIETILYVLGDYGTTVAMSTLMQTRHQEHPTEIAKLYRKRLAVSSEQSEGGVWNTARIKNLTGGDQLTGRYMRADYIDFDPTHKLVVSTNAMPSFGRVDTAVAERILKTEFQNQFLGKNANRQLKEQLRGEAPGILAWVVEGCLEWQRVGLRPPPDVESVTEEYLKRADDVRVFIDDECVVAKDGEVYSGPLYKRWLVWCQRNGVAPGPRRTFTERVQKLYPSKPGHAGYVKFLGLRLKPSADDDEAEGEAEVNSAGIDPADLVNRKFSRKVH
jgi:putative DNA primase/helicase